MADYVAGTTNVWPNYAAGNTAGAQSGSDKTLGKDEFLKILIAQIKNQDPMKPMEDKEFIAQMAQFTSVEQLMNMATSLDKLSQSIGISSSLIGKTIGWTVESTDSGTPPVVKTGIVDSISVKDGQTFAVVDGEEITLGRIVSVADAKQEEDKEGESGQ